MNLQTLQYTVYEQLGFEVVANVPTVVRDRVLRYLNSTQREVLTKKGIGTKLRRASMNFSTVAGSPYAVLPQSAVSIFGVTDRTNGNALDTATIAEIEMMDPHQTSTAAHPRAFAVVSFNAQVAKDPSAAGQLTAVSDDAADGATKTVFVEVERTGGYFRAASVALNGVTPVNVGPADSLTVSKFYIALAAGGTTTAAGNILLKDGAGNEIARIPPTRSYPRYTKLQLYPIPSAVAVLHVDVELHIEDMAQASDEPYLPEDFHDILESGALKREYKKREKITLYKLEDARGRERVAEMRMFLNRNLLPQSERLMRFSQLGPYFPPGT